MKTVRKMFARLDSVTRADGTPWPEGDQRNLVVGKSGLVTVGESEHHYPGMKIAKLTLIAWLKEGRWYGCEPGAYWRTSYGSFEPTRPGLVMRTSYSVYDFTMLRGDEVDAYMGAWGFEREKFERMWRDMSEEDANVWRYIPAELEEARRQDKR